MQQPPAQPQGYPPAGWGQPPQTSPAPPQAAYGQGYGPLAGPQGAPPGYGPYGNGGPPPQAYGHIPPGPYQQPAQPQPPAQPAYGGYAAPSAFPPVEQAGMYGSSPAQAGHGLMEQAALPPWLAGAAPQQPPPQPLGMQARSLVDEQALPEWLRQQPEERARPNVAGWIGASAAEEPLPSWMAPAFPEAQSRGQPGPLPGAPLAQYGYAPQPAAAAPINPWQQPPHIEPQAPAFNGPAPHVSEDLALPDWLQAQASANGADAQASQRQWGAAPAYVPPQGPYQSGGLEAEPTVRTPNASHFEPGITPDLEPDQGGQDWDAPGAWDFAQAGETDQDWNESSEGGPPNAGWRESRGPLRGAPLAPNEIPPWLRQATAQGQAGGAGTGGRFFDESRRQFSGQQGWDTERSRDGADGDWDDPRGGYDDPRGGYDDRFDNRYENQGGYDERDGYDDRGGRGDWDDEPRDQMRHPMRGREREARDQADRYDQYDDQRRSYGEPGRRTGRDPYAEAGYDDGNGRGGYDEYDGHDDEYGDYDPDQVEEPKRPGWGRIFKRGR